MPPLQELFDSIKDLQPRSLPPIEKWQPVRTQTIDIVIRANGEWYHEGSVIRRHEMVKLFASVLCCEEEQRYYLVTPQQKFEIEVEDAPLLLVEMQSDERAGQARLSFRSNLDDVISLGKDHPLRLQASIPRMYVRRGLWAKVNRNVYYQLVEHASEQATARETGELIVYSQGESFSLGSL